MKKYAKIAALLMAFVLVIAGTVGVTMALLTDKTESVKNTFTFGKVNIELKETTADKFELMPGYTYDKDPTVTVKADSEACWLFVKVESSDKLDAVLTWSVDSSIWTELEAGVWYKKVADTDADQAFAVLTNNKVSVANNVTADALDDLDTTNNTNNTLTFTAYACQLNKDATTEFTFAEAWDAVKNL